MAWLRDDFRPDVVHLTNSMFAGFARSLKRELGVPVVCSLQGEDLFLDQLREPWKTRVRELLRERARDIDAFQVNSAWYADTWPATWEWIEPQRMFVVPLGLTLDGRDDGEPRTPASPLTIGYLARICPEKGLHVLVEAFRLLRRARLGQVRAARGRLARRAGPALSGGSGSADRRLGPGRLLRARGRGGPGGEDPLPPVAGHPLGADHLPRAQGALRARSARPRRAGGPAAARRLPGGDRGHRRRPARRARLAGGPGARPRDADARSRAAAGAGTAGARGGPRPLPRPRRGRGRPCGSTSGPAGD